MSGARYELTSDLHAQSQSVVMDLASNGSVTATVRPPNTLCDVILLVDASASLSGVFQGLMNDYLLPCLEYFSGGSVKHSSSSELQYGPVQFGLVTMNSAGLTYRQACSYYPVTCDAARVLQWLKEMRFEGGLMEHSLRLSEGFAAVLELCDLMSTTREPCLGPDQVVEQYCVLVCNFPPSTHSCVESMKYGGKTHEQLSKIMVERKLKVSVISPRNLLHFKTIFERGLISPDVDTSDFISDCQHSVHAGHTALFQGFTLQSLKKKREEELLKKAIENEAKQTAPLKVETHVDTQTTVPPSNGVMPNQEKSGQLLSTSYDSKTPPNQSSPIGGNRNPSPSVTKTAPSSAADENPTSVPPPSVFAAPSPRDPTNVASPQRQPVSSTLTSVSPPSAAAAAPITRVPSSTQLHTTRASFSGSLPMQGAPSPSSAAQQNVQQLQVPTRSLPQGGAQQVSVTALASSQPSHMGSVATQQSNPNQLVQGSPNMGQSLNRAVSSSSMTVLPVPSSMSAGFPNVVATCTSLPSTSTSPIFTHLGIPSVSIGSQPAPGQRQPAGSMAAAVAAAESALLQASAQVLPSRMGQMSSSIPGQSGGIGQGMTSSVMASQPTMNLGLTSLVGSSQSSTTVTTGMISSTQAALQPSQQNVTGTQPNSSGMQPGMQGQQPRPPMSGVQQGPQSSVAAQPTVQSQFGTQGPGHVMSSGPAQSQAQAGMAQNMGRGQQPLSVPQSSLPNPGMAPTQPGHMQPQSMQPGMVGAQGTQSTLPNTLQQQPPLHSGSQPIMATGQHLGQPGAFGAQAQQQLQATIWTGTVDVMEQQQRGQRLVKRPMQCTISAKRDHIPELLLPASSMILTARKPWLLLLSFDNSRHPENWPQHLTMQAYPKQATSMIMSLMKLNQQQNMVRVVTFNFAEPPEQVYTLRLLMSSDQTQKHFGIVHFNSVTPQSIKALILVWNEKAMQFTGLIPIEQMSLEVWKKKNQTQKDKFVEVLKQVFSRRQPQPGQPMGMGGPQQPQLMGGQQLPQQSGVSTMSSQQQMVMSGAQPNAPGTSADPSMLSSMGLNTQMGMMGMQPQSTQQQMPQSRPEKNAKQLEKILMLLERSTPEQQQQIFQKMPQLTPEMQQSLLQRVNALRLQKQQLQRQQQQQQLHAMNQQQQQQQGGMMTSQMPDVMGQMGMSGGLGQQQQQAQQSQMARQPQQQGMPQGGMGMQMGMQRASMQAQQQPPGMDPNTFQWQSQ